MSTPFARETKKYQKEIYGDFTPKVNEPDETSCRYCADKTDTNKCIHKSCPYLLDRAKRGDVSYNEFVFEAFRGTKMPLKLRKRISKITKVELNNLFLSPEHRDRFYGIFYEISWIFGEPNKKYLAALYLLTAKKKLWKLVREQVYARKIDFKNVHLMNLNAEKYAYFLMAKGIFEEKPRLKSSEMIDDQLISDKAFKTIIHAILVKKYGEEILKIKF